ncbi:MAG: glycosyltransferase family 4 protein [Candidatus Thorarchaeota archaeon]
MSKKIKICFVQTFTYAVFNPASKAKIGGAEVDLYNIANELIKDNRFEVYFLVADFGQKPLEIYNNIKVIKGHSQKKNLKNYLFSFFIFYKKLAKINADIYLTANLSKYVGFTNFYCRIYKKIHIHRTEHQHQVDKPYLLKKILRGSSRYFFFYLGFKNVNYIVVQNEEDRATLKRTFNFPSMVIRNSYPINKVDIKKRDSILWVARCKRWKRPEVFINLAKEFPNEKFIMVMPIADDKKYFENIKREASIVGNLQFIPGVPFSEIEDYYKNAIVFINTSLSEGFPNSFNQSMNSSTPILSLNINPDNFIIKNQVGIYCNNDFNTLKESLNRLLKNQELWDKFSENSYKFVNNEMNIKKAILIWKKIFIDLLLNTKFGKAK